MSTSTEFDSPGEVTGFNYEEAKGHLLVVIPHKIAEAVKTAYGETDAVLADIHDISAKTTTEEVLVFPKILVSSLSKRIGGKVLATLGQGIAKPGQSAPWILEDQSKNEKAVAAAQKYLASVAKPAGGKKLAAVPAAPVETWGSDEAEGDLPF